MTTQCKPSEIIVGKRMRPLNAERVADLERSIGALGLQHLITVRYTDNKPTPLSAVDHARQAVLIAGAHRLQAVKNLGWSEIPIREFDGDDRAARMWEIAENLHRAELTELERDVQIAEWIKLAGEEVSAKVDPKPQGGRPESGINKAARDLGIEQKAAQRAAKIAGLSDEAKAAAVELGLDDNQSALLQASKAKTADEQVEALKQRKAKMAKTAGQPGAQLPVVEQPQGANDDATTETPGVVLDRPQLRDLQFDEALEQFADWFAELTITQTAAVEDVIDRADRMRDAAQAQAAAA